MAVSFAVYPREQEARFSWTALPGDVSPRALFEAVEEFVESEPLLVLVEFYPRWKLVTLRGVDAQAVVRQARELTAAMCE